MFQDIDWCEGQWCPLPRPVLSQEDIETIEGFGLQCTFVEDVWTGAPRFEGWLEAAGVRVSLFCQLQAHEGDFAYVWRLSANRESVLDMLPGAYVIENEDPIAAVAEAVIGGAESRKHWPANEDHIQDSLSYAMLGPPPWI